MVAFAKTMKQGNGAWRTLIVGVLAMATTAVFYGQASQFPWGWVRDDGYFYAKIAYNLGIHGRSSFDGINITDGYHILWGWGLGAVAYVVGWFTLDRAIHLFVFLTVSIFIMFWLADRFGRTPSEKIVLASLVFCGTLLMETSVLALLVLVLYERAYFRLPANAIYYACIALVPLARIDGVIFLTPIILELLYERRVSQTGYICLALVVGVAVHLAAVHAISGHFFTVSSEIKATSSSDHAPLLENLIYTFKSTGFPNVLVLAFLGLFVLALVMAFRHCDYRRMLVYVIGASLFLLIHMTVHAIRPWYFTPSLVLLAYLIFRMRSDILAASPGNEKTPFVASSWLPPLMAAAGLAGVLVYLVMGWRFAAEAASVRRFISGVNTLVPSNRAIFAYDGSGYLGYFVIPAMIDGDGLVNSHEYLRTLQTRSFDTYVLDHHICYAVTNRLLDPNDKGRLPIGRGFHDQDILSQFNWRPILIKPTLRAYWWGHFILWHAERPDC